MSVVLDLTETLGFTAFRSFLLQILPTGIEVIRGEVNRVPEPEGLDFVIFWPTQQERLGTNYTTFTDCVFSGSITGTVLTVTSFAHGAGSLIPGLVLFDTGTVVQPNSVLGTQITGNPGDVGTYNVAPSQTVPSETIYEGIRADMVPVEWVVQVDVHGPNSADNTRIIESLFRSEYATDFFDQQTIQIAPLFAETPKQTPFLNSEQQYEYRWTIDLHLQINPIVNSPQQFADQLKITLIPVEETYGF